MKYHFLYLCKHKYKIFVCCSHEIHLQGNLAEESFYQEKESKLLYLFCIPFNEQQKCHVTNIYTERKNKSIILHSLREKQKYHITSRSSKLSRDRFLETFVILIEESFYLIARKGK